MSYKGSHFIGGNWLTAGHSPTTFSAINPSTEEDIGNWPEADHTDVDDAVAVAREAFPKWRDMSRINRADLFDNLSQLLKRNHKELLEAISYETGKSLNEAHAEVIESLHMCQVVAAMGRQPFGQNFSSELATKDVQVLRKPKGVIAIISPWNFPLAIGSFWCAGPALVEGNTVVHKPSELTPMVNQMAAELYEEAGFPPGVYNLIHGAEKTGKALVRSDVETILFTGSAAVGQEIRRHCADTWHKTCSCEMGSKSAVITFTDGDLNLAVDVSLASAFKLSGQRCVSSGRMLVQRDVYGNFVERFVAKAKELRTTCPWNKEPGFYGPLISKDQMDRVAKYNYMTTKVEGVEVLLSGERQGDKGYFLKPHVYTCEWGDHPFLKEEVFGPHVAIIPFTDIDDAIRIYNDTEYGLALGVVTDDFRKHRKLRTECDTGMLYINGGSIAAESHCDFGGVKKSGNGWKSAVGTVDAVTEKIAVTTNYEVGKLTWAQGMK